MKRSISVHAVPSEKLEATLRWALQKVRLEPSAVVLKGPSKRHVESLANRSERKTLLIQVQIVPLLFQSSLGPFFSSAYQCTLAQARLKHGSLVSAQVRRNFVSLGWCDLR